MNQFSKKVLVNDQMKNQHLSKMQMDAETEYNKRLNEREAKGRKFEITFSFRSIQTSEDAPGCAY